MDGLTTPRLVAERLRERTWDDYKAIHDSPELLAKFEALNAFLSPIRERREQIAQRSDQIDQILRDGSQHAQKEARETLRLSKEAMHMNF